MRVVRTVDDLRRYLRDDVREDQGLDTRDWMLGMQDLFNQARAAGIDIVPLIREVLPLANDVDHYGWGSTKELLERLIP